MKKQRGIVYNLLNYVIDYAPIIATVVLATFASLASIRKSITAEEMLQWTIVLLALLATTQLVDRFRIIRSLDDKIENLLAQSQDFSGANNFFVSRIPNLQERLSQAQTISINGISLSRTSDTFWTLFKDCIGQGGKVRLLMIDPEHPALEIVAERFHKHQDIERVRREVAHALDNFETLKLQVNSVDGFQLRLQPFVPPYGIWVIDEGTAQAEIWVELYSFRDTPEPTFHLLPHRDGKWFVYFQQQFETMWNVSRSWEQA